MKFVIRFFFFFTFLLASSMALRAGHIIGADIRYECLGNNSYRITMDIYIDCACRDCASFDSEASFGVYSCGGTGILACERQRQLNTIQRFSVRLGSTQNVPAPEYECLESPPDLCVRRGTYTFVVDNLAPRDVPYYIVYQRCCRNETISNIIEPRSAGATYFVEITPEAQRLCNNSATFNEFPPTVVCANFPFEYDHSAVDRDGDDLRYRFCAPLLGGGIDGGPDNPNADSETCTGIIPRPGCPPPYEPVIYRPPFSDINPMGGSPQVSIDPISGLITGTPTVLGQFVVGVCVDEFRDGSLINTVQRDFQFNTAACDAAVFAGIEADQIIDGREFYIRRCGDREVEFVNISGQRRFIREFLWEFPDAEPSITDLTNPLLTFPDIGSYQGRMIVNPNLPCSDSIDIFIDIFPSIEADFTFEYDTCVAGEVVFTDLSVSGSGNITNHEWNFADGNQSNEVNPEHLYIIPGIFPVNLTVTDVNDCQDEITIPVRYFPVPEELLIGPNQSVACEPAPISFFNLSFPIDSTYEVIWDFGDGNFGSGVTTDHIYEETGSFTVNVTVTSPIGCTTSETFPSLVNILPSPRAGFDYSPRTLSSFNTFVTFTDESRDAISWEWDFGGAGSSTFRNPQFNFPDTGVYEVRLIVTHESGCQDTLIQFLDVEPKVTYFLPNAFTPNGDGLNDEFRGTGVTDFMEDFTMTIWNRWGEMVFETRDPNQGWNGQKFNSGPMSPPGVYVCVIQFLGPRGERQEIKGFATLVQ